MRSLRLFIVATVFATACAVDPRQTIPTAPSSGSEVSRAPGLDSTPLANPRNVHETVDFGADADAAATFALSGVVTDRAVGSWKIANATVNITPGIPVTKTDSQGKYTAKLVARTYTIRIAASGYATASVTKALKSAATLNFALVPTKPAGATARCKDRAWSFSKNRSGTCSWHGGVQYWVCPGLLCRA